MSIEFRYAIFVDENVETNAIVHRFSKRHWVRKTERTRDYPCEKMLDMLKVCCITICSNIKEGITVLKSAAY